MNRFIKYIFYSSFWALAFSGMTSCSDDAVMPAPDDIIGNVHYNEDGTLAIEGTMHIPGIMTANSRALGEDPDFENLSLYMLIFEEGEGLRQFARLADKNTPVADEVHNHNGLIKFSASLQPTEKSVTIHLIATNQPNISEQITIGIEERVITSLYTDDGNEAYWQRIVPGTNIPNKEDAEGNDATKAENIKKLLTHVPMIRNFSRVSVEMSDAVKQVFTLTGLYVFNTVDRGSVAPYVATNPEGSRFVNYYNEPQGAVANYTGKSYKEISNQNHTGTLPSGVTLINKIELGENISTKSDGSPVYFYERPARENSTERTYVILKGLYNSKTTYYKVDLGYIEDGDEIGRFNYYNLLRNFDYCINLKSIESEGYGSMNDAAKGAVFNNFSASVEAKTMTSISDGEDMIFVNFTSYVFTSSNQWVNLDALYLTDIRNNGGTPHSEYLKCKWEPGIVIKNVVGPQVITTPPDSTTWRRFTVTGNELTNELQQQTLYIYRGEKENGEYGLYRVITFFSHKPWEFEHMNIYPGLWESFDDFSWDWSDDKREIGQYKGSPLTLFFELPAGLPQALFPLEFVIESERQNIQNAYQGNAVVRSVPASESLFYTDFTQSIGQPKTSRIQYVKTVTWADYFGEWSEELVGTGSRIVRCRFLTITDLNQDVIGDTDGTSRTNIRISNEYFGREVNGTILKYFQESFLRDANSSDPSPRSWDFSSGIWDNIILLLRSSHDRMDATNNVTDELMLIEGGTNSMTTDTDEKGRYIQTSNANDMFRRNLEYAKPINRILRVEITTDATSAVPKISFTAVSGFTPPTAPSTPKSSTITEDGVRLTVYEVDILSTVNKFNLNIQPANAAPTKFYKIDFYPRWDEMQVSD